MMNSQPLSRTAGEQAFDGLPEEELWRMGTWGLLATLLRQVPDGETLARVAAFAGEKGGGHDLQVALAMLGLAASRVSPATVDDEFHDLFVGIGRGELLPYGSWYQTGFLMERPLSELRQALANLGYTREEANREPEDHVAALCEVMALMIQDRLPVARQAAFFHGHIGGWMGRFFQDLGQAEAAVFYRSVGRLGMAFLDVESEYFEGS